MWPFDDNKINLELIYCCDLNTLLTSSHYAHLWQPLDTFAINKLIKK